MIYKAKICVHNGNITSSFKLNEGHQLGHVKMASLVSHGIKL